MPTLEAARAEMAHVMDFVHWYRSNTYTPTLSPVSGQQANATIAKFGGLSTHLSNFQAIWTDSKLEGPDRLVGELDIDLLSVGKLDMDLFATIIRRMNLLDKSLPVLERAIFYFEDFQQRYAISNLPSNQNVINLQGTILHQVEEDLASDASAMKALVERCNLYYQNRIAGRTYYLQFVVILLAIAAVLGPSLPTISASQAAPLAYSLVAAGILGLATWIWFETVDKPNIMRHQKFMRKGRIPIPHHIFEAPAFLCIGLAVSYESILLLRVSADRAQATLASTSIFVIIFLAIIATEGSKLVLIAPSPKWQTVLAVITLAASYFIGIVLPLVF